MKTLSSTIKATLAGALLAAFGLMASHAKAQDFHVSIQGERGSFSYSQRDRYDYRDYRNDYRYAPRPYVRVRYEEHRPAYPVYRYQDGTLAPAYVNPYLEPKCVARNINGEFYRYYC